MTTTAFGLAALVAAAATRGLIFVLARIGIYDSPSERSSHSVPTLRGGGVAIFLGTFVGVSLQWSTVSSIASPLMVAGLGFGLIGLVDDLAGGARALGRLGCQVGVGVATTMVMSWTVASVPTRVLVVVGGAGWLCAYVNAFNFMDGINGLSVGQAVVAGATFACLGLITDRRELFVAGGVLAAASLGFAPYNFPTARVFVGDIGSYFMGAWVGVLVLVALHASIAPEAVIGPIALYAVDTGTTLVKRVWRGKAWHEAHREHTYQRLIDLGWSHARTTMLVSAFLSLCSALGVASELSSGLGRIGYTGAIASLLVIYLWLPRLVRCVTSAARSS